MGYHVGSLRNTKQRAANRHENFARTPRRRRRKNFKRNQHRTKNRRKNDEKSTQHRRKIDQNSMKIVEKSVLGPPGALGTLRGRPGTRSGRSRDAKLTRFGRQVGHLGLQDGAPGRHDRAFGRSGSCPEPLGDALQARSAVRTNFASIFVLFDGENLDRGGQLLRSAVT